MDNEDTIEPVVEAMDEAALAKLPEADRQVVKWTQSRDLRPWHRRFDLRESQQAYHAFVHFRDLPQRIRTTDRAFTICRTVCPKADSKLISRVPGKLTKEQIDQLDSRLQEATMNWKFWRRNHMWDQRSAEFDAWCETQDLGERLEAIREMNKRHASIAQVAINKVVERLMAMKFSELTIKSLILYFKEATAIERRARGEATEIVRHQAPGANASDSPDLSKLSDAELAQWLTLQQKMQGNEPGK